LIQTVFLYAQVHLKLSLARTLFHNFFHKACQCAIFKFTLHYLSLTLLVHSLNDFNSVCFNLHAGDERTIRSWVLPDGYTYTSF